MNRSKYVQIVEEQNEQLLQKLAAMESLFATLTKDTSPRWVDDRAFYKENTKKRYYVSEKHMYGCVIWCQEKGFYDCYWDDSLIGSTSMLKDGQRIIEDTWRRCQSEMTFMFNA